MSETHASENGRRTPPKTRSHGDSPSISPSRLARHWGVHINTIYRDIRKGALKAYKLPGGQFRIHMSDARRYGRPVE